MWTERSSKTSVHVYQTLHTPEDTYILSPQLENTDFPKHTIVYILFGKFFTMHAE